MSGNPRDEFESLARRYWAAWGDALRSAVPGTGGLPGMGGSPPPPPMGAEAWQESLDWWSRLAHGPGSGANDALAHFNSQARHWYGRMQDVAARFAGQDGSAADVASAWKDALGAGGGNPFPGMLRTLRGHGLQGLEQWIEDASPWLDTLRGEGLSWLRMPAFGAGREHQERQQALAAHLAAYQQASSAYAALMLEAQQEAFTLFEAKLIEHEEPGRQLQSARALFDLWIDAAEEAYAEVALSEEFREVYGRLVNAQMRVRAGVQRMVEDASAQFGMPTRSELDGAHRKLAQLEREVRRLRDALASGRDPAPRAPARSAPPRRAAPAVVPPREAKQAAKKAVKTTTRRAVAGTSAARTAVAAKTASRKAGAGGAAAPAKRSAGRRFGGAIPGSVPRAPEPIGRGAAGGAAAARTKKTSAKNAAKTASKKASRSASKTSSKKTSKKGTR